MAGESLADDIIACSEVGSRFRSATAEAHTALTSTEADEGGRFTVDCSQSHPNLNDAVARPQTFRSRGRRGV